jgi:two-component system chemotaxis sensor kinase CheA
MSTIDDKFLQELRDMFKVEAVEHVEAISAGLLALEKMPSLKEQSDIVETVFRAAHSLKGAARAVAWPHIESLCGALEDVFSSWRGVQINPGAATFDTLYGTLDAVTTALDERAESAEDAETSIALAEAPSPAPALQTEPELPPSPEETADTESQSASEPVTHKKPLIDTVRIAVEKLENQVLGSEEMLGAKITFSQRAADLRELAGRFDVWKTEWAVLQPQAQALRLKHHTPAQADQTTSTSLLRLLDFFDWSLDTIKSIETQSAALEKAAEQDHYTIGRQVDDLLENSKKLLLLPFGTLAAALPKLVRDLCHSQGKEAELSIQGKEIEIDRRILEEMKDPLIHLLRNSLDHGVEAPAERARRGKPACAVITLSVKQVEGNKVQLLLSDDGAGIDTVKLKQWALKHGLISADQAAKLNDAEAQELIFKSGVTTSAMITQISGRGLGMAIVREKAEKLGGTVTVESRAGLGTTFRILVPSTRSTFRGLLVETAGRRLIVPTAEVERVARAKPDNIKTVQGHETLSLDGRALALVQLADVLELPQIERRDAPTDGAPVLILGKGDARVAFAVDAILDEQEVLVKPLRKPLSRVRNIAAATVLGTGQVVPILNVTDLLKSATKSGVGMTRAVAPQQTTLAHSILVAEDSITSRMMIKNILESAGYKVKTAVDGMEAYTFLRAEKFDLVVSDVEMPRLNGFGLTAKIRADAKLTDIPVVLVTALETREDRERGADAGANAYLIKSGFDQRNLLEAIQRLI